MKCLNTRAKLTIQKLYETMYRAHYLQFHLTELIEMELVLPESTKKNQLQTYKLLYNSEGQDGRRFMLGLHRVQ